MSFIKFLFSKTFLKQLILAAIAVIVIVFLTLQWLDHYTRQDEHIKVPDLSRMALEDVDQRLNELELRYEVLDSANFNPDYPPFAVIDQAPKPGKAVKENRKIYLTINPSGYRKIAVPDGLIRKTRRMVESSLRAQGFKIGEITYKPDVARDAVLELRHNGEKIEPGTKLMKTSEIDLVLGDGSGSYDLEETESDSTENGEI